MDRQEQIFIKELLSNLKLEIQAVGYIKCPQTWQEFDYVPDFNKFYLIEEGEGLLKIDGKEYYPKPGQLYLMPQGVKQSYSYISADTFLKYWVHFTATIGDVNLFDLIQTPYYIQADSPRFFEAFAKLNKAYQSTVDFTSNIIVKSCLYELISMFLEQIGPEQINLIRNNDMNYLNAVLKYIDNHLDENITIKQLAGVAYLHPNYFIRLFKNKMGVSPINYINRKRMQKAKELLRLPDITIQEVAVQSGFRNVSYFFHIYKKQMGMTPNEYRLAHFVSDNQ